jgi:hypothetical protein
LTPNTSLEIGAVGLEETGMACLVDYAAQLLALRLVNAHTRLLSLCSSGSTGRHAGFSFLAVANRLGGHYWY